MDTAQLSPHRLRDFTFEQAESELDLLNKVIDTIVELDPDIITGWEIQKASWGYVSSRGQTYGKPSGHTGTVQSDLIGTRSRCI